jgi:hypothetical protein
MSIELGETGAPLTDDDVVEFENEFRAILPEQYRRFLLKCNGGVPSPDIVEVEGAPGSPTDVQVFFGITRPVESSSLRWNKQMFSDRIPDRMLPVACDSGGNLFCLSVSGEDLGNLFYVDLESLEPTFYLVATDFDSFLEKITAKHYFAP